MNTTDNVDPAELRKFAALAASWWDPAGPMRPLHEMNPVRLEWIDQHAVLAGKTALDVGCGGGLLTEAMHLRGAQVTGIDPADKPLKVAELHALETGGAIAYRKIDAEALAEEAPATFDVVTCMELLEHVPDPARAVRACRTLARPGGWVFFSTINRNLKSFLFAIVGAEYILQLLPKGTHEYARFIRPSELASAARAAELEVIDVKGMRYRPITRTFTLGGDTDINYLLACRRPQ